MALQPTDLSEINYWDLDMFVDGDPHAAWKLQREQAPIMWHDQPGGEAFWSVTSFDGVKAVHADPLLFSSERNGIRLATDEELAKASSDDAMHQLTAANPPMIHMDPPGHGPRRKVLSHKFTPRSIAQTEELVREITVRILEEAADKRDIDFIADIAHRIPAEITFRMMDIPEEKWARLAEIEHLQVTPTEPEFWPEEDKDFDEVQAEFYGYFFEVCSARTEDPGDDWLSTIVSAEIGGEKLGPIVGTAEAGLLLAGGVDTTRAASSTGGMIPLLENPDQLEALRADPGLISAAVEEFVRWSSPIVHEKRTVMRDTEFMGEQLKEGQIITMWSGSANRDASHFDRPDAFDIQRSPNRHIGFAWGEHYCLGVHLAKLTLRVEFEELLKRFKSFELTGPYRRVRSNFVGGLVRMPMHLEPA